MPATATPNGQADTHADQSAPSGGFSADTLEHRCTEGHYWREHTDGTVTPSWGLGGTHLEVADAALCPEPATDEQGLYACPSCGESHRPGEVLQGMSCTPWEYGEGKRQECEVPIPACAKPAVWTRRWGDQSLPWPDEGPGSLYSLWWLSHRQDGQRLISHLGGGGKEGREVIDMHTGEILRIASDDARWEAAATRRASLVDLPSEVRQAWPREPASSSEASELKTPWLLAHTNPDYMALCQLREQGQLALADHERQFMWAVITAAGSGDLHGELRRRASKHGWQAADFDALLVAHDEL